MERHSLNYVIMTGQQEDLFRLLYFLLQGSFIPLGRFKLGPVTSAKLNKELGDPLFIICGLWCSGLN